MKVATAISMSPFVVLCLTGTWLVEIVKDAELYLDNFNLFRCEREPTKTVASNHGGVLIAINKHIPASKLEHQTSNVLRGSTCSIRNANYHMRS